MLSAGYFYSQKDTRVVTMEGTEWREKYEISNVECERNSCGIK